MKPPKNMATDPARDFEFDQR